MPRSLFWFYFVIGLLCVIGGSFAEVEYIIELVQVGIFLLVVSFLLLPFTKKNNKM